MKYLNKQACNLTLAAGSNAVYTPSTDAQVRAITAYNPTADAVELTVSIAGNNYMTTSVIAGGTEVVGQLNNQQIVAGEAVEVTGEGLNLMMTVVEIVT